MSIGVLTNGIEVQAGEQKVVFQSGGGRPGFHPTVHVRDGASWRSLFDAARPLVQGSAFDLAPAGYQILENTPRRSAVFLTGVHEDPAYAFDLTVETREGSPWLEFRIVCHLRAPLEIDTPQPTTAFWMQRATPGLTLDQGPVSIYGGPSWGNSFPAAYLWDEGKEAVVFFHMEPMTWMSARNLRRFLDCRVATVSRDGASGLGLHALTRSGGLIPAGHLVIAFSLLAGPRPERPSPLDALARTVDACAEILPASAPAPENRVPPYETSWRVFAEGVSRDLLMEDICWTDLPSTWRDLPLFPEHRTSSFRLHSDYAINSSEVRRAQPAGDIHTGDDSAPFNRRTVTQVWDNATCNAYLAPWIAFDRIHPDAGRTAFLHAKADAVPAFYDREARLFRWMAEGVPLSQGQAATMANGVEMSWENFLFALEPLKVHQALPPEAFDPAIPGRFLMACQGLIEFAHNVHYIFPQFFDAYAKQPIVQADIRALGKVREPFQAGTYAWLMLAAHDMTGEARYLDEAAAALDTVLNRINYTVINARYTVTYASAVDVPVAETFGNGYAVAAARKLRRLTGDARWDRYAADYANLLLRMAFWYDDRSDAMSRDLNNLGLVRAHGGHYGTCPWENVEAYLPLAYALRSGGPAPTLWLKFFNLQRNNAFHYFAPVWTDCVAEPNPALYHHVCQYLPIENFYTLEFGGTHGSMGRCIYMCSIAFWNYLLYEAFAGIRAEDALEACCPDAMVLNLDALECFDDALQGHERNFIVFNPAAAHRRLRFFSRNLPEGRYAVTVSRAGAPDLCAERASEELAAGLAMQLGPLEHARVHIEQTGTAALRASRAACRAAQGGLAHAYQLLQERARDRGSDNLAEDGKKQFLAAMEQYRAGDYAKAGQAAAGIVETLMGGEGDGAKRL